MTLTEGMPNTSYTITDIVAKEDGMKDFLFSLGCFPGEDITIISQLASNMIVNIKDARYSIDSELAKAIVV
ncbi:MAG: FeoA family protein [Sphaerochaetaceae bacterium]|nr:FeoA family protein [Sphaerochaetaceae bacterium]MDC7248130.1 FeoA family protein [Sphaerochaetaceae bacterium]